MNQINDVEGQWQLTIRKAIREVNANPFIINCKNGLYNVLDDSFRDHEPTYYSTVQMKASYNSEGKCPRFMEFLNSALEPPEINLKQEIFGYFLVPITKAQKCFVMQGKAQSGKSTLLCGKETCYEAQNVSSLIRKFGTSNSMENGEYFCRLTQRENRNTGTFKAITGEDKFRTA